MADSPFQSESPSSQCAPRPSHRYLEFLRRAHPVSWLLWAVATLALAITAGNWAVKNLLGLPDAPSCRSVSQANGYPSIWLYCAEQIASDQTPESLKRAILLVSNIPPDASLRATSDRLIKQWSQEILQLAEAAFQDGDLQKAVEIARKIPASIHTHQQAVERIEQWESMWEKAEEIYQQAEAEIDQQKWSRAIEQAGELLTLGNQYWATIKYQQLVQRLQAAKDMQALQAKKQAKNQAQQETTRNPDFVEDYFARREQERARAAAAILEKAQKLASSNDIAGLEAAIDEAQQILYGTPRYEEAQQAIEAWRDEIETIEDRPYLERARELANQGDLDSLEAAIDEARQIGWGRALYDDAQTHMEQWREQASQLRYEHQTRQLGDLESADHYSIQSTSLEPSASPTGEAIDAAESPEN